MHNLHSHTRQTYLNLCARLGTRVSVCVCVCVCVHASTSLDSLLVTFIRFSKGSMKKREGSREHSPQPW